MTILQRSVSLSAGEITPSVVSKGPSGLSSPRGKKPSIDELRKQVSRNIIFKYSANDNSVSRENHSKCRIRRIPLRTKNGPRHNR